MLPMLQDCLCRLPESATQYQMLIVLLRSSASQTPYRDKSRRRKICWFHSCRSSQFHVDKFHSYYKVNTKCYSAPAHCGKATDSPPPHPWGKQLQPGSAALESEIPSGRKPKPRDNVIHIPAPVPTPLYMKTAIVAPKRLSQPQKLLLVLDLNGTLLWRARASTAYTPRPLLDNFLAYALTNHSLLIWSSATPKNVTSICARLFGPQHRQKLLGEWARNTLGLTPEQYRERVQVYKRLDRIWDNLQFQRLHPGFSKGERWGQHNTILVDDSGLKASAQPYNHVEIPEFVRSRGENTENGRNVLSQV